MEAPEVAHHHPGIARTLVLLAVAILPAFLAGPLVAAAISGVLAWRLRSHRIMLLVIALVWLLFGVFLAPNPFGGDGIRPGGIPF
jgi:hypothetical protein